MGAAKLPNSKSRTMKTSTMASSRTKARSLNDLLLFLILAAVLDADAGRHIGLGDGLLHLGHAVAEIHAFEAGGDGDIALQVLAPDFGFGPGISTTLAREPRVAVLPVELTRSVF